MTNFNFANELVNWLQSWPDGIVVLDEQSRIMTLTNKATEICKWHNQQVAGVHIHDIFCVPTRSFEHAKTDCPFATNNVEKHSTELCSGVWLTADGTNISIDYRIIPIQGSANTSTLITFSSNEDRLHNQAEMEKLAEYTDKNPTPMAEFNTDGQMLFGNSAMQEALLEFGFNDAGLPNFLPDELISICQEAEVNTSNCKYSEHNVSGHWYSWHFHSIESQGETSILGYAFETTRQKLAEEEARLAQANARRDFYAKMIHELRTPLNAIVGYSDVLLWRASESLTEKDQTALRTIKVAGLQLSEMVSDTLDISKIEAGKMTTVPEEFKIGDVIKEMREQIECLASAKALIYTVDCDVDLPIYSDQGKVKQILINLLSNAIKYTKVGSIHLSVTGPAPARFIKNQTIENTITLCVRDTGIGIPEEQIPNLFLAYQQIRETKNHGIQGTGIGLALVYELTQLLGGEIQVTSEYGKGSCFTVEIPQILPEQLPKK